MRFGINGFDILS